MDSVVAMSDARNFRTVKKRALRVLPVEVWPLVGHFRRARRSGGVRVTIVIPGSSLSIDVWSEIVNGSRVSVYITDLGRSTISWNMIP